MLRPALAHVDDRTLTGATGYMHDYADRRLPVPGAIGLAATVLGTAVAALAGHPGAVVAGGAAVLAMAVWLLIYRSVSAPVNRRLPHREGMKTGPYPSSSPSSRERVTAWLREVAPSLR